MMMHITERKDGRFMGRFVIGQKKGGKKIYQYVYGKTYEEALQKVQIGMEIESQYRHRKHITVLLLQIVSKNLPMRIIVQSLKSISFRNLELYHVPL